jgi:hypothetical protein
MIISSKTINKQKMKMMNMGIMMTKMMTMEMRRKGIKGA